jgi:isopentenyldiphosphate isomerase
MSLPDELLNVYDEDGQALGAAPRGAALAAGRAAGAINVLLIRRDGSVLLQRRPIGKENGGCWDKSVGGHVQAGESFDAAAIRETGEELFDDPRSARVRLAANDADFERLIVSVDLEQDIVMRPSERKLGLRDVRRSQGGDVLVVPYHLAVYVGRTDIAIERFSKQPEEIDDLRYFTFEEIDRMFLRGELAPNMGFLWLAQALRLLGLVVAAAR